MGPWWIQWRWWISAGFAQDHPKMYWLKINTTCCLESFYSMYYAPFKKRYFEKNCSATAWRWLQKPSLSQTDAYLIFFGGRGWGSRQSNILFSILEIRSVTGVRIPHKLSGKNRTLELQQTLFCCFDVILKSSKIIKNKNDSDFRVNLIFMEASCVVMPSENIYSWME